MAQTTQLLTWVTFTDDEVKPDTNRRCLVHAMNNWFIIAMYESDDGQFWDKDGQPVVAPLEWCYMPDRE